MSKAYLNALAEEGTRQDLIDWLCKLDAENDRLRDEMARIGCESTSSVTKAYIEAVLLANGEA